MPIKNSCGDAKGVDNELIGPAVLQEVLQDEFRIEVHREYLKYVLAAIK